MPNRILPLLALGLAVSAAPAQAQLGRFCGNVNLVNITLDARSVSDPNRPWLYVGVFGNRGGARHGVVNYSGPAGTMSQAVNRSVAFQGGTLTQVPLVQWPKHLGQPSLGDVAAGVRVECP